MKLLFYKIRLLVILSASVTSLGCSTIEQIKNEPISGKNDTELTSGTLFSAARAGNPKGITLILAFSGGGTRASALSYGVLEELRDTNVTIGGKSTRLLDEVDFISSVSGGSITAAYYGLFRDKIFYDFKDKLLTRDLKEQIISTVLNPLRWFSNLGITDHTVGIYADAGFGEYTFGDMLEKGPPYIAINATDLSQGARFSFLQDYFNLICSDLSTFPVARAVAASAAMPLLFDPIVLKNYDTCGIKDSINFLSSKTSIGKHSIRNTASAALSYSNKKERPFVHLVDGGVSDNLGLRIITDPVELTGGIVNYFSMIHGEDSYSIPRHFAIIAVNASVKVDSSMDKSSTPPSMRQTLNAVTDAQLQLYNNETTDLIKLKLEQWVDETKTQGIPVEAHLISIELKSVSSDRLRNRLNLIPTTLGLPEEEVELLIGTGRKLLRENPQFQKLLKSISSHKTQ